jgi:hypothetical protein
MNDPMDKAGSLASGHAGLILDDLLNSNAVPAPTAATVSAAGWCVTVVIAPQSPGEGVAGLTDCDRDCLALLDSADQPLSAARIRDELERRGEAIHGLITVKRSLAKLRRMKLVSNSRKSPRGYFLPERLPHAPGLVVGPQRGGVRGAVSEARAMTADPRSHEGSAQGTKMTELHKALANRALIDAAIRKAVREEVLSNARLGFPVCTLRDGKVVWLSPQEIFEQFANEPAPQQ